MPASRGSERSAAEPDRDSPLPRGTGTFRAHVRGFGFVDLDIPVAVPGFPDLTSCFVPPPLTGPLLDGDRVDVVLEVEPDGRASAQEVTLRERVRTVVFGVVEDGLQLRVDPHVTSGRWQLQGRTEGLVPGVAVLAEVVGEGVADPSDEWEEPLDADAILERVLVRHRVEVEHPPEVVAEAEQLAREAAGRRRSSRSRRDLRGLTTFTIDDPSSRDLDDSLSVYPADRDGGIRVCVHIADVSTHVRPGSLVDAEARRSGTSLYLPGWTRPMLPPVLSDEALSLVPGADRDTLTVELRVAADGEVTAADVYASRIRSDARLSYEQAAAVLTGQVPDDVSAEIAEALRWLRTAAARLGVQRLRRGGVEARRVEPELTVAVVGGVAEQVAAAPSNPAHLLIERLMVAANEAVARWLVDRGLPGVFRVHPQPGPEAAAALEAFCAAAGFHPGFGPELTPLGLAALSAQLDVAADATAAAVWDVLLGFLGRATYEPQAGPHFGLASDCYLHFTSPIRRYADLLVHRVVHAFLDGARDPKDLPEGSALGDVCAHLNAVSRVAAVAERQTRKSLWLVTLSRQVAAEPETTFHGRVTGVSPKGVFVTLEHSQVSGMVSVRELPGRGWDVTDDGLALRDGERSLGYGDRVEVQVVKADPEAGELELRLAGTRPAPRRRAAGRASGSGSRSGSGGGSGSRVPRTVRAPRPPRSPRKDA